MNVYEVKKDYMKKQAAYRREAFKKHKLRQLFFEFTLNCNEHCWHCGSRCGDVHPVNEMTADEWKAVLDHVKENFGEKLPQINVTGGEPLLYPHFEEVMSYAHALGFKWGMTSNAILITKDVAEMLKRCGMGTISVSIDGLRDTHDRLRGLPGAYDRAMAGVQNLIDLKFAHNIMITTVINHETIHELEPLYKIMCDIDIDSWRVIGVEPLGRALQCPEKLMTPEDQRVLMDFIRRKRAEDMPVTYGCSHYLGLDYEMEVRDWYFFCMAGVSIASITSTGDVTACLDIERTPSVIQGNIRERSFADIWENEFKAFRYDKAEDDMTCKDCTSREFCMGGSCHTWDFEEKRQRLCLLNELNTAMV